MQNAHRLAAKGTELRHCGQSLVVEATSGSVFRRFISAVTGFTTKKKITAATMTKLTIESMKAP